MIYALCTILVAGAVLSSIMQPMTREQMQYVGKKIWYNECGCSYEKLLFWSPREPFPSLGIGHFIWYPQGYNGPYTQGFPDFIAFIRKKNSMVPAWMGEYCPWSTRELFYQSLQEPRMQELKTLLEATLDMQAEYMIEKMYTIIPEIINALPNKKQKQVQAVVDELAACPQGLYVLVDYLNFKGSGLNQKERYNNQGWGLLQVFEYMITKNLPATPGSCALAAEHVLAQRVAHAPAGSADTQSLPGWINRIKTYNEPFI